MCLSIHNQHQQLSCYSVDSVWKSVVYMKYPENSLTIEQSHKPSTIHTLFFLNIYNNNIYKQSTIYTLFFLEHLFLHLPDCLEIPGYVFSPFY